MFQLDVALEEIDTQRNGLVFIYNMTNSKYSNFDYDLSQKMLTLLKGNWLLPPEHLVARDNLGLDHDYENVANTKQNSEPGYTDDHYQVFILIRLMLQAATPPD